MEKDYIELKVPSNVYYLESVCAFIGKLSETLRFSKKRIADIQLAVDEICSNAVYHGSTCISSGILMQVYVNTQKLKIVVRDKGKADTHEWLTPKRLEEIQERRSPTGESGHGLYLIKCLTDEHNLKQNNVGGTDVTAIFYRKERTAED